MKSIVQEASSIVKAIDSAWKRAEEPTEFSVRIHEYPQKNMFGFTTKSAKISLFYEEERKKERPSRQPQKVQPSVQKSNVAKVEREAIAPKPKKVQRDRKAENGEPWNSNMVSFAQDFLSKLMQTLNVHQKFSLEPQNYHLKITFEKPIFDKDEQNRILFRNCAHLMLQAARNNFKRPLKGFKVVLTTADAKRA